MEPILQLTRAAPGVWFWALQYVDVYGSFQPLVDGEKPYLTAGAALKDAYLELNKWT